MRHIEPLPFQHLFIAKYRIAKSKRTVNIFPLPIEFNDTADYSLITSLQPWIPPGFILTNRLQTGILKMFEHLQNDLVIYSEKSKRNGNGDWKTEFRDGRITHN